MSQKCIYCGAEIEDGKLCTCPDAQIEVNNDGFVSVIEGFFQRIWNDLKGIATDKEANASKISTTSAIVYTAFNVIFSMLFCFAITNAGLRNIGEWISEYIGFFFGDIEADTNISSLGFGVLYCFVSWIVMALITLATPIMRKEMPNIMTTWKYVSVNSVIPTLAMMLGCLVSLFSFWLAAIFALIAFSAGVYEFCKKLSSLVKEDKTWKTLVCVGALALVGLVYVLFTKGLITSAINLDSFMN